MLLFYFAIFLSAFLLFQVQPLIGKVILPYFGYSSGVWTTLIFFFQTFLLLGYCYSHILISRINFRKHLYIHLTLLIITLVFLPLKINQQVISAFKYFPSFNIFLVLSLSLAMPYFILATTSPILQAWFVKINKGHSPYKFYSLSNLASLLALLSFPFLFEKLFGLSFLLKIWSLNYLIFVLILGMVIFYVLKKINGDSIDIDNRVKIIPAEKLSILRVSLWLLLSTSASVILLAVTNRLTCDVAAVPFLFILPLTIYLLSFIITFSKLSFYNSYIFYFILIIGVITGFSELSINVDFDIVTRVMMLSVTLFSCCMSCHGELFLIKPASSKLTFFYLIISVGGFIGGLIVSIIAPLVFNDSIEYEASIVFIMFLITLILWHDLYKKIKSGIAKKRSLLLLILSIFIIVKLSLIINGMYFKKKRLKKYLAKDRNFYGIIEVSEIKKNSPLNHKYKMNHGHIVHGFQYRNPQKRGLPTTYFCRESGVGIAITMHPANNNPELEFKVGVLGLGVGTIASYANKNINKKEIPDYYKFYEINPLVADYAQQYFTYLKDARSRGAIIDIKIGDARIEMQKEIIEGKKQNFDVLAVDAFSGDSIPLHLLTIECFEIYFSHLKVDGILAIQITNRYVDILPVIVNAANKYNKQVLYIQRKADKKGERSNTWVLLTNNKKFLENSKIKKLILSEEKRKKTIKWTDDHSSLFDVLK